MIKIIRLTTVPLSLDLLIKGQPSFMQQKGFNVLLSSAKGEEIKKVEKETGIKVHTLPLTRTISPLHDLKALWQAFRFIKKERPEIVHTHTPKAGIIGMLAAKLAGVPIRMHTVAGLPLMETQGAKRKLLNAVERLTSWAATKVYPNSYALKEFMLTENLVSKKKLSVIGKGSSNGIDTSYFSKEHFSDKTTEALKKTWGIPEKVFVVVFVGRIVGDKGVNELVHAFNAFNKTNAESRLVLVGEQETALDPLNSETNEEIENNPNIIVTGWQQDVRPFLAIADLFAFPSYREGFPNVALQAGAMQLPSIVTNINGSNEIVVDQETGMIIPVKETVPLLNAMVRMSENESIRKEMGIKARKRIKNNFEQNYIWNCLLKEYIDQLNFNGIPHTLKQV